VLELTQIGKKCHGSSCAIFKQSGDCVMPKEGVFCKVVRGGVVKKNDTFDYISLGK
jgi:MOSC domain-containing protein YiiM